ncbi:unnamed protein product [Protopolystoma xenopodis]|uniref:Helix-turn-helix domain-containing protein n=1 Tax=Protopolystoma xenopodis TaxID=117903 RepID=A0A3S5B5H8_9PLAT|nr:unnamed protein product [Protopolystoma xenopodis]
MDAEEKRHLPFLDVEIKKRLFLKKSHAGITHNFQSNHTYGMKRRILRSMVIRSLWLTDSEFWEEEMGKLTQMSLGNGYREEANGRAEIRKGKQEERRKNDVHVYPSANWLGGYGRY